MNAKVTVMGQVSFLGWSRKASCRRCPLSRGLKEEEEMTGDKTSSLRKSGLYPCPLATHHSPLQSDGTAAGACCGCFLGPAPRKTAPGVLLQGLPLIPPRKSHRSQGVAGSSGPPAWGTPVPAQASGIRGVPRAACQIPPQTLFSKRIK